MNGDHPLGWPRALTPRRSPCRIDQEKGRGQHPCSTAHRDLVLGYRAWKRDEEQAAEEATLGYETELADYWSTREKPTLKSYLVGTRRV
jgi:hypothetical protein